MVKPTKKQAYNSERETRLLSRHENDKGFKVPSSTENRFGDYYRALDTSFEINSIIKPQDDWAMAPDKTQEISLEGLTPCEIDVIYREVGELGLSEINEQIILKKAITEQVRWWKEEIRDRIDDRHPVFYCKEMRLSTLAFVNNFVFIGFCQARCIIRNLRDDGVLVMNVAQHKIPNLADVATGMTHSMTHAEKYTKNFYPGAFFSKKVLMRPRDYLAAQGCFNFVKRRFQLSTKENPVPFEPTEYYNVDFPKLLTFAMALEQVILDIEIEDLKEEPETKRLQEKYLPEKAFSRALPKHKNNFLREAFDSVLDGISKWNRASSEHYNADSWMPFIDIGIGLSELEEIIWAKFCRTFQWTPHFKPKPS